MMYKNVFLKIGSLTSVFFMLGCGMLSGVSADCNINVEDSQKVCASDSTKQNKIFRIKDTRDFMMAINNIKDGDEIILESNIVLTNPVIIKSSICIDLNGYTITMASSAPSFTIGYGVFDHKEPYTIHHPGYYKDEVSWRTIWVPGQYEVIFGERRFRAGHTKKVKDVKRVWCPERDEIRYRFIYNYNDNIYVVIKNGKIVKEKGCKGCDGIADSDYNHHGLSGDIPNPTLEVVSGTVSLKNVTVEGGEGGDGGNGSYQSLAHFIMGGGDGGNGGNGANGGYAIRFTRDCCGIEYDSQTKLIGGRGGRGGKGSKPNPHYWVYSGSEGTDGKNGEDSVAIRNN